MLRTGLLQTESNPLWYLDFKGYYGFENKSQLPYYSVDNSKWKRLATVQNSRIKDLVKYLRPLMQDTVFFYLLSMLVMLDTSDIEEKGINKERLQKVIGLKLHYLSLFKFHCERSPVQKIRRLMEFKEELNQTVACIKELAKFIKVVFDLYKDE